MLAQKRRAAPLGKARRLPARTRLREDSVAQNQGHIRQQEIRARVSARQARLPRGRVRKPRIFARHGNRKAVRLLHARAGRLDRDRTRRQAARAPRIPRKGRKAGRRAERADNDRLHNPGDGAKAARKNRARIQPGVRLDNSERPVHGIHSRHGELSRLRPQRLQ